MSLFGDFAVKSHDLRYVAHNAGWVRIGTGEILEIQIAWHAATVAVFEIDAFLSSGRCTPSRVPIELLVNQVIIIGAR